MIKAIYDLDMTPMRTLPIIINVSQYDDLGRTLVFNLFSSSGKWTAPTSAAVTFEGGKPDGKFFSYNCAYSNGTVTVTIQQQMTAVAGKVRCKIKVKSGNKVVESAPIIMVVDAAAVPDGSDMSKTDINDAIANATQKIVDQVKDNIPPDYSQLSTDVSSLKEDLTELRNDVLDEPSNPNLIDWNKCEKGKIFLGNGLYQDKDIGWISNIIEVEPNTTYVFSSISTNQELYFAGVYEFDANKNYISFTINITKITTQANTKYIQIQVRYMTASGQGAESGETKDDLSQDYLWNKTKLQKGDTPTVIADTKLNSSVKVTNNNLDTDVSGDIAKGVYAYDNMTETTSWYKNKIMMSYGDSIVAMGGWQPYVQEYFGIANGYNRGIGGTTVSNNGQKATLWDGTQIDGWMCCDERIAQMAPTNNDFLLILAGHNDWGFNVPIGEIGDTLVDSNFKSAYALMLKKIQDKFPTIPIICMTPINGRVHTSGVNQDAQEKNSLGLTMTDYAEAVIDVCRHYSIPCIDLNSMTRINVLNASSYLQDVIHPNANGWKRVASAVIQGMKVFEPINNLIV